MHLTSQPLFSRAWISAAVLALGMLSSTSAHADTPNLPTGKVIPLGKSAVDMALSKDQRRLWVTDNDANSVTEIDLLSQQATRTFAEKLKFNPNDGCSHNFCRGIGASGVVAAPDESAIFVSSWREDSVSKLSLADGKVVWTTKVQRYPQDMVISADGQTLWVFNLVSNTLSSLNAETGKPIGKPLKLEGGSAKGMPFGRPIALMLSADGRSIYASSVITDSLDQFDTLSFRKTGRIEPGSPFDLALDPEPSIVWAQYSDGLLAFSTHDNRPIHAYHYCRNLHSYEFARAEQQPWLAITLPEEKLAMVVHRDTGLLTHVFRTGEWPMQLEFINHDQQLLVLNSGENSSVSMFDLTAPNPVQTYVEQQGELFCKPEESLR